MRKAEQIQSHLNKCTEAKRRHDWSNLYEETEICIAAGADSAPLIFGLRAEALLRLNRQEEAIESMEKGPNFEIDDCIRFFGPVGSSSLLLFRAQVDLAAGRFDDAVGSAQRASRLDPNNKEAHAVVRRMKAAAAARTGGNELFKAARYSEAIIAYGEGLGLDPYNAVLLFNRAACCSKLGQYEKAVEDCSAALNARSGYRKARLRRADCYAKMGQWGECVKDCEVLMRENPDDEEIGNILKEAKKELEKMNGGLRQEMGGMVSVTSQEHFRDYVKSPGTYMVLFCKKEVEKAVIGLIEHFNQRYPSVNFLKVDVEDHPLLAKSEGVNSLPAFVIYIKGSRAKEIPGDNYDLLEKSIKNYIGS
ncbi:tetratricopeptide repeat (TPR)-containing protein [Striga asiatica]|uniref:Tetratricopeptide repeat (TPR)-containing protein n=1 Tax=Striga asiatica TaxID=4170 RepID=A0A5A7QW72_STRAF|nr:tetratricopeptide repeat (TPR)-containing protein [Striga asiatica]